MHSKNSCDSFYCDICLSVVVNLELNYLMSKICLYFRLVIA